MASIPKLRAGKDVETVGPVPRDPEVEDGFAGPVGSRPSGRDRAQLAPFQLRQ
jgi:hypothetical protein